MRNENHKYQNGPSADDERISDLLALLPRVDAPGDFSFRVKARIASARSATGRRSWLPATAAVAAPLGLVLAVGGYFVLTTVYSPSTVQAPPTAELRPATLPTQEISNPVTNPPRTFTALTPSEEVDDGAMAVKPRDVDSGITRPIKTTGSLRRTNVNAGGVSEDQTLGIGKGEVPPKVVDANRGKSPEPPPMNGNPPVSAKSVLVTMGIEASYSGSTWTIASIQSNSSAARSGLKAGDVIEAVNGRALTGTTLFDNKFTGRSVLVRRDGKTIQINLKH